MKPIHLVFGPDGNRRYARKMGISYPQAYDALRLKLLDVIRWSGEGVGVEPLTLWVLQEYNLRRDPEEVSHLVQMGCDLVASIASCMDAEGWRTHVELCGELDAFLALTGARRDEILRAASRLRTGFERRVNVILAYNADAELQRALTRCRSEGVEPTFESVGRHWSIPPVDLFFRTGQPNGFVNLSSYWPRVERGRLISTDIYPQELTQEQFRLAIQQFRDLRDSVGKLFGPQEC